MVVMTVIAKSADESAPWFFLYADEHANRHGSGDCASSGGAMTRGCLWLIPLLVLPGCATGDKPWKQGISAVAHANGYR